MTHEWTRDGTVLLDGATVWGSVVSGAESAELIVAGVSGSDSGVYRCRVRDVCGVGESDPIDFRVCPADANCDGGVDGGDVEAFILGWMTGEASGDFNRDGGVDGSDLESFFVEWSEGC